MVDHEQLPLCFPSSRRLHCMPFRSPGRRSVRRAAGRRRLRCAGAVPAPADRARDRGHRPRRRGRPLGRAAPAQPERARHRPRWPSSTPPARRCPPSSSVTARWNAGLADDRAPIQWLLVTFPATVGAGASATYRLVTDGSVGRIPPPPRPLRLTQNGDQITVDTGAAIFRLGGDPGALFDEVVLDNGTRLIGGGSLTPRAGGADGGPSRPRASVASSTPGRSPPSWSSTGAYDMPPVGGGGLGSLPALRLHRRLAHRPRAPRRSPGRATCLQRAARSDRGRRAQRRAARAGARHARRRPRRRPRRCTAVGDFGVAGASRRAAAAGQTAAVRQLPARQPHRAAALSTSTSPAAAARPGSQADGGMLARQRRRPARWPSRSTSMHRYEPQALRLLADGALAVDLADDQRLARRTTRGSSPPLAVAALPAAPSRARPRPPGLGAAQPAAARLAAASLVRRLGRGRRVPGRAAAADARRPTTR